MKKIIIAILIVVKANAVVCSYDSSVWTSSAYVDTEVPKYFRDGMDELTDKMVDLAFFTITEFNLAMIPEKRAATKFARANAVSAALDYEINGYEELLLSASKVKGDILNTQLEASVLLNEIQLGINAIKTTEVIGNEKKLIFGYQ